MKNNFFIILSIVFYVSNLNADNITIEAKNISIDKDNQITVFEKDVIVKTKNKIIKSDIVKYNKSKGYLILENNVLATDKKTTL